MKAFIDSSFFISLIRKDDSNHEKALRILRGLKDAPVIFFTSHYVIDEVATVLSMRVSKSSATNFLHSTTEDDFPMILSLDTDTRDRGRRLFQNQQDKNISMIDCYCAVLMHSQKIKKCFTFDKQFKKLGFEIL
ncbi:MAG: PIN domain-containing protein [Patescibacteria group bacterium]